MKSYASSGNIHRIFLITPLTVVLLDQASKWYFSSQVLICNQGAVLGILVPNLTWIAGSVLVLFLWESFKKMRINHLGLGLIVGGGFGNLIDRLLFGCVRDWIVLGVFPAFNLADLSLTIGILIVLRNLCLR